MATRKDRSAIVVGLLALGVSGCGDDDLGTAKANLSLWRGRGPASYKYVRRQSLVFLLRRGARARRRGG